MIYMTMSLIATAHLAALYERASTLTAGDLAGKHLVADEIQPMLDCANEAPPQLQLPMRMFCLKLIRLCSTQTEPNFGLAQREALRVGDIALTAANSAAVR